MEEKYYVVPRDVFNSMKDLVERYQLLLDHTEEQEDFFDDMRKASIVECEIVLRDIEDIEDEQA
jgi:hypothetical protein